MSMQKSRLYHFYTYTTGGDGNQEGNGGEGVRSMNKRKWWLILVVVVLVGLGIWRGGQIWLERKATKTELPRPTVVVQTAQKVNKENSLSYTGNVQALNEAVVSSKVGGRVTRILVDNGMRIKAGQPLAVLDNTDYAMALSASQATLKKAEVQETTVRSNYDRIKVLYEQGAVAEKDMEELEAALAVAEADLESARVGVANAEEAFNNTTIIAPINGLVANRNVMLGQMVAPGTPLMLVQDMDTVWVTINIEQKKCDVMKPGLPALINVEGSKTELKGTVKIINPAANIAARVFETRIKVDNSEHLLKTGMFVRVKIFVGSDKEVLAVPQNALISKDGLFFLFTVDKDKISRQQVTVGDVFNQMVEVKSGLKVGQQVVISNVNKLKDQDLVRVSRTEGER